MHLFILYPIELCCRIIQPKKWLTGTISCPKWSISSPSTWGLDMRTLPSSSGPLISTGLTVCSFYLFFIFYFYKVRIVIQIFIRNQIEFIRLWRRLWREISRFFCLLIWISSWGSRRNRPELTLELQIIGKTCDHKCWWQWQFLFYCLLCTISQY